MTFVTVLCASATASDESTSGKSGQTATTGIAPLHQRIDEAIAAADPKFQNIASQRSTDAEFFRRLHLDLLGTIPSADAARGILNQSDKQPLDRAALVEKLLAHPKHARRLQSVFDTILMERSASTNIPVDQWREYLRHSFLKNKPWNQLALEILSADGADPKLRPAARFYLDRNFNVDQVTRDIGRVFLGVDLECAQCHDHPVFDDYLQRHYYGLTAFLKRSSIYREPKTKAMLLAEKAEGDVSFTSVFTDESGTTSPRLLNLPEIIDPAWAAKVYIVPPKKNVRSVPAYSRRQQLGWAMTAANNAAFRRNIVNRLWALVMGRGLVEPLDLHHAANPPSHPKVLDLLADEFLNHRYDIRWLLRELALSDTYQRSSFVRGGEQERAARQFAVGLLKPLTPEQLAWSVMEAAGVTEHTLVGLEAALVKSDPKFGRGRSQHLLWREAALSKALIGSVDQFVAKFAANGGQKTTFDATADQSLFLLNGTLLQQWLIPQGNNLTARLAKLQDPRELTEELYSSVLTRRPTQAESDEVAAYLADSEKPDAGIQDLTWALLTSAEFRFNH